MHADDNANKSGRQLDTRDEAIVSFAQSLLKRTLSESFVGMPLTDSACVSSTDSLAAEESNRREFETRRNRLILNSRSLSLELQKQKHRIAAQLVSRFTFYARFSRLLVVQFRYCCLDINRNLSCT